MVKCNYEYVKQIAYPVQERIVWYGILYRKYSDQAYSYMYLNCHMRHKSTKK